MSGDSIYTDAVDELVAVGAAIASNCEPCLEHHVGRARQLEVPDEDLVRAVQTARAVKAAPARNVAKLAGALLRDGGSLQAPEEPSDASPCCRGAAAAQTAAAPGCVEERPSGRSKGSSHAT